MQALNLRVIVVAYLLAFIHELLVDIALNLIHLGQHALLLSGGFERGGACRGLFSFALFGGLSGGFFGLLLCLGLFFLALLLNHQVLSELHLCLNNALQALLFFHTGLNLSIEQSRGLLAALKAF